MQDRFKCRVWSKELGQYIHPTQINFEHGVAEYIDTDGEYKEIEINGCLIEQCTGLKDKNRKLIFEGDIVRQPLYFGKYCSKVVFENHKIEWLENGWHCDGEFFTSEIAEEYEVIGNIHETPEILEDKER